MMSGGVVTGIRRAYGDPRGAMARRMAEGLSEPLAMRDLFLACGLGFVASVPTAVRAARTLGIEDSLAGTISAHLFGYLFVAPLLAYGLAAVLHLAARAFGGRGGFLGARSALFRAALLGAPIAILVALAGVATEIVAAAGVLPLIPYLSYAGFAFWLWLLAAGLAEAEGLGATLRVAAVLALVFLGVALGLRAATASLTIG